MTTGDFWSRAIILVDMNAFFASVEQLDHPKLRQQPVVVTNGSKGSCIITASYEARAFGIKTGMRLREAQQRCPTLIRCPSRPKRYTEISKRIMKSLEEITPDIEIFSIDEAFLDVTHCQSLHGHPDKIGKMTKQKVWDASHLLCSVGVSGDKTTAKYAAKCNKPDGFTIIPPWEAKDCLADIPVTELCGIAKGIGHFLNKHGVINCGDMEHLPISILSKRFGNLGRRIWYMCQGADPDPVHTKINAAKSMGHGKVLPPGVKNKKTILIYLQHMSEKLAARLRRHNCSASIFYIGIRILYGGWITEKAKLNYPTDDGRSIYLLAQQLVKNYWQNDMVVSQVQITALDPQPWLLQPDLFETPSKQRKQINNAVDQVNQRYGEFTIAPARLLGRSEMPNVISPAWKTTGPRETIN